MAPEESKPSRYIISVKTKFGFVGVEGDSISDVINAMDTLPELMDKAYAKYKETTFPRPPPPTPIEKPELEGIIKREPDGTYQILLPIEEVSGKQIIYLIAYDQYPRPLTASELADFVSQCWKRVHSRYVSSYLTKKIYRNYFVSVQTPEGQTTYKLSGIGRSFIKSKLIPEIKKKIT